MNNLKLVISLDSFLVLIELLHFLKFLDSLMNEVPFDLIKYSELDIEQPKKILGKG
jgi:hypothetical protein